MILTLEAWEAFCKEQAKFDQRVLDRHGLKHVPIWERVTAFRVEAAECINELKGVWKWWSVKEAQRQRFLEEFVDALKFITGIASVDAASGGVIGYHAMIVRSHRYHESVKEDPKRLCNAAVNALTISQSFGALVLLAENLSITPEEIRIAFEEKTAENLERLLVEY